MCLSGVHTEMGVCLRDGCVSEWYSYRDGCV